MQQFSLKYRDLILLFLNIVIRLLFVAFPFWGLEYEDSFIYNDSSRFLIHDSPHHSFFLTEACIDGSYEQCKESAGFGGHFLGFPIILSKVHSLIGYHPANVFILNLCFSSLLLISVFIWHRRGKGKGEQIQKKPFSLTFFLTLMLLTPFITVFQTSGLAETMSSFWVMMTIIFILKTDENDFKISHYSIWVTFLFLMAAIFTKRENLILLSLLILIPIFRFRSGRKVVLPGYLLFIFLSLLSVSLFSSSIQLFSIESNEGIDIGSNTFAFGFLIQNLSQAFLALMDIKYWGLTGFVFILAIITLPWKNKHNKLGILCLCISILYLLLYSSHYRSYYQVQHGIIHPFETLRYAVNYFPLICIFISSITLGNRLSNTLPKRRLIYVSSVLLFLILVGNSLRTRIGLSSDEYFSRIEQVQKTLEIVKPEDVIITDLPIVFHCFVSENQRIIDYYSLSQDRLTNLISENDVAIYMIRAKEATLDSLRYGLTFDLNEFCSTKIDLSLEKCELIKFCGNDTKN